MATDKHEEVSRQVCDGGARDNLLADCFKPPATKSNSAPERHMDKPFNIGIADEKDIYDLAKSDPTLVSRLNALYDLNRAPSQEQSDADAYSRKALGAMAEKYGIDRLHQVLDTLHKLNGDSQNGTDRNAHDFQIAGMGSKPTELNPRLYNLADLCQPGHLEQFASAGQALRDEGLKTTLSLRELNAPLVSALSDPAERRAYISFNQDFRHNPDFAAQMAFLHQHPEESFVHNPRVTPSETMRNFTEFKKLWRPGQ